MSNESLDVDFMLIQAFDQAKREMISQHIRKYKAQMDKKKLAISSRKKINVSLK